MTIKRQHVLSVFLMSCVLMLGCMGGGGQSAAPVAKDVSGINATIRGFMQSVNNKDSGSAFNYLAGNLAPTELITGPSSETHHHSSAVHTLMVYDFGADINNPDDNHSYNFTVNESDIIQPTSSLAQVKAYYKLSNGQPLWLSFVLVKENGVWLIEGITMGDAHSSSGPTHFTTATYFPVIPGTVHKFANFYGNDLTSEISQVTFAQSPATVEGSNYYELIASSTQRPYTSLRASGGMPFLDPSGANMFYANQETGLWVYGATVNNDKPFKMLETYHDFNSEHSFLISWLDVSSQSVTGTCTIQIGAPTIFETGLQSYSAVPLTYMLTYSGYSGEVTQKWRLWLAPNVGIVGTDEFSQTTDTMPILSERIIERKVNSAVSKNEPLITTGTLADVVVGSQMTPVTFAASGGVRPYKWLLDSSTLPSSEYSFASATGVLSGTPQTAGSYSFEIKVKDKYGRVSSKTFSLKAVTQSSTPTDSYQIGYNEHLPTGPEGHYEAIYYVSPSGATTITDAEIISVSPSLNSYEPWIGYDTMREAYMLSLMPERSHSVLVRIHTADGKSHDIGHEVTASGLVSP